MQVTFQACSKTRFGSSNEWRRDGFPSEAEHKNYKKWIEKNNLNEFGDPADQLYAGGSPIFYSHMTVYQYLTAKHPEKPWNPKK